MTDHWSMSWKLRGQGSPFLRLNWKKADAGTLSLRNICDDGPGVSFFLKIFFFFLKPNSQDLSFYRNANVVFIEKSEFFSKKLRLIQKP